MRTVDDKEPITQEELEKLHENRSAALKSGVDKGVKVTPKRKARWTQIAEGRSSSDIA